MAGEDFEVGKRKGFHTFPISIIHHCPRQGMLRFHFQGVGLFQKFLFRDSFCRNDIGNLRFSFRNGAGFIHDGDIDFPCIFQGFAGFEEDAVFSAHAVAYHNGHRRCQAQGTGAGNDEDADGVFQGRGNRSAQQRPKNEYKDGNENHRRNEHRRYFVRNAGNGSLGGSGIADHADNLGEGGVLPYPKGPGADIPAGVHGGGAHRIAGFLVHRHRFAG